MGFYEETYVGICALSFLSPTLYPHSHKSTAVTHAQCMCVCVWGGIWPRLGAEKRVGACGNSSRSVRELKGMSVHPGQQMLRVTPQLDSYQLLLHPPPFYAEFHLVLHPSQSWDTPPVSLQPNLPLPRRSLDWLEWRFLALISTTRRRLAAGR